MTQRGDDDRFEGRWIALWLASCLPLTLLLPIGLTAGIGGLLWQASWLLHLLLFILAVILGGHWLFQCLTNARGWFLLCGAVTAGVLALTALEALHPIVTRDALIHHVAVPHWWIEQRRIVPIPWHDWSFYPMLLQLGFSAILDWNAERICVIYHALYLFLMSISAAALARRIGAEAPGVTFAFLICLTLPLHLRLAATPLVDLGLGAFSLLALLAWARWLDSAVSARRAALECGAALGFAMASKYNGFLFAAVCFALALTALPFLPRERSFRQRAGFLSGAALIALLCVSPWLIKNAAWTGNPVYPLARAAFDGAPAVRESVGWLDREFGLYQRGVLDIVLLPFTMLLRGRDDDPRYFDGVLSPLLFLSCVAFLGAALGGARRRWVRTLWLLVIVYGMLALQSSGSRVRYFVPILGPLAILAALGAEGLAQRFGAPMQRVRVIALLTGLTLAWSLGYAFLMVAKSEALQYLPMRLGQSARAADEWYLKRLIPEYPAIAITNTEVAANEGVYLLYTANLFYYYLPKVFCGGYYSEAPLVRWLRGAPNAEALQQEFLQRGLRFILVHQQRMARDLPQQLTPAAIVLWNEFREKYLRPVSHDGVTSLWRIEGDLIDE